MSEHMRGKELTDDSEPLERLHEHARHEALRYLDNPHFDAIIDAAAACGVLPQEAFEDLDKLTGDDKYDRLRSLFADINPRNVHKQGFVERHQLTTEIPPTLLDALQNAAESVGMTKEAPLPPEGDFKLAIVHGGAGKTPKLREQFLLDGMLDNPNIKTEFVAMLGIDRSINEAERQRASDYAGDATTESELMEAATVDWLTQHGLEDILKTRSAHRSIKQGGVVSGTPYHIVTYDLEAAKADGRLADNFPKAIFIVEAPMDATRLMRESSALKSLYKTRADTQDTLDFIAQAAGLDHDQVLSISHQPVLAAQDLLTRLELLNYDSDVTSAGYYSEVLGKNPSLLLSELCKTIEVAGKLYDITASRSQELPAAA